jgi:hypothetical protein
MGNYVHAMAWTPLSLMCLLGGTNLQKLDSKGYASMTTAWLGMEMFMVSSHR